MNDYNQKISWREAYQINKRALSLWCRECPMLFLSTGFYSIINALIPYLTLYFSAQLLNELAGARRSSVLIRQVIILLFTETAALSLKAIILRWRNTLSSCVNFFNWKRITNKILSMDFCAADDISTYELLDKIQQTEGWGGWGINKVYYQFRNFLESLFRMLGAIALSVSFFMLPVKENKGWLAVLNHPFCILLLVMLAIVTTVISPYLETKEGECWTQCDEENKLGNRGFSYYVFGAKDPKRSLDIRMYRQDVLNASIFGNENAFTRKSKLAGYARGKMGFASALSAAISKIFMGIVYLFVCLKAWGGAFGAGSVTQYVGSITSLSRGMSEMLTILGDAKINSFFVKNLFEFLDIPNNMYQGSLTVEKRSDRNYEIEFRNVSFRYPHTECYALKKVSLKFKVGERLAVVGQNGSGKTTFIKLLCRLYDPTEGEILLNGIDIRKYNYKEYMSVFSIVFQDFQLLSFPLGQNIAVQEVYDKEKVMACCEKSGLSERTASLPDGLDTFLYKDFNENGVQISGGEAQKIAIARSLYHDAPFIILDEPTAALDPVAEYEIYTKFNEIVGDRTAIYISHRLSSCRFCDEIIVFHEGNMIQQGTHESLLSQESGKYHELWHAQAQYYTST